jgi:hypothetical protein
MKSEAHVKPIPLVLQPTILHSIFFFISLKIQQQTKGLKAFFSFHFVFKPNLVQFCNTFFFGGKRKVFSTSIETKKERKYSKKTHYKAKVFSN